jgi:putative FmdB family regulatory protein
MPIYGYRCEQCGHELEVLQSMSDAPLKVCPNCAGPLRKMIYPAGLIFKGSGYYTTDYKAAGSASRHGDSDAAASSKGSGDGASETAPKPAADSAAKGESKSESKSEPKPGKDSAKPSAPAKPASD